MKRLALALLLSPILNLGLIALSLSDTISVPDPVGFHVLAWNIGSIISLLAVILDVIFYRQFKRAGREDTFLLLFSGISASIILFLLLAMRGIS